MRSSLFPTQLMGTATERLLAGRLAGLLYVLGGATVVTLPLLPGGTTAHYGWIGVIGGLCLVWGLLCLFVVDFEDAPSLVFLIPAAAALVLIGVTMATTGGAGSPARYFTFFLLVYVAAFYPPRQAWPLLAGCVAVQYLPLAYDSQATGGQYVGELLSLTVVIPVLGAVILKGKTLLVELRSEAEDQAMHDPLTALANRRAMLRWLEERFDRDHQEPLGLLLVDLDGFKDVNTLHGYQMGDRVLCRTARALESCVREDDMVARLGGDEFAVLVPVPDATMVDQRVAEMMRCLRDLGSGLDLHGVSLTASVGWVIYPHDATTIDELIGMADICLRDAKSAGKDRAVSPV